MDLICLDTDVLINHKRSKIKDKTLLFRLTEQGYQFAVTTITVYELLRGNDSDEDNFWKDFFRRIVVLQFDYNSAEQASSIYRYLKTKGKLIPTEDILIAAITLQKGIPLATYNIKHFERIEGLRLIDGN